MKRTPSRQAWLALLSVAALVTAGIRSTSATEVGSLTDRKILERARQQWAFQPIDRSIAPPASAADPASGSANDHPIDRFVRAALKSKGLTPAPAASPRDQIRRLYFNLIGLPPTPEAIDAFTNDPSDEHYARVVDQLLARPQYGERWARHWLDLARYTESTGFEYDRLRDNAWPYRDYVIRSFNTDKPYDRFMREQIAGDVLEPITRDGILGSSLLVCGAYDQAGNSQANLTQRAITREEELEDLISVVGQTFLGLTLNCARCHDHKFDPITLTDYYRIKSVFDGIQHGERPIETPAEAKARETRMAALRREMTDAEEVAASFRAAGPSLPDSDVLAALAPEQRSDYDAAIARAARAREALTAASKPETVAYAGRRLQPAPTQRLRRGDVKSPDGVVTPGALSAFADILGDLDLSADASEGERRIRFARWLTDPRHPLPARVIVNRVWHYHFGQGLVTTPSDFGAGGTPPTHPELLDWLAARFMAEDWSLKVLHRQIVNSSTFRQSSEFHAKAAAIDADNQWLWRFQPRRLEAETLRDAMLAVSGRLNTHMGGPSFRPFTTTDFNATFYHPFDKDEPEYNRRTVYRMNVNSGKDPLLDAFDCPDPSIKAPRRAATTTPLQALGLMNGTFTLRQARLLAERASASAPNDVAAGIRNVYRLALGRNPTVDESERAILAARDRGLSSVSWVLLNSTEFLYVR